MRVRFLEPARNELLEAVQFYNSQSPELSRSFIREIRAAVGRIHSFPEAWHPLSENTRRCLIHRFPYGIIYQVIEDEILIVAVAHLHREPNHWRNRT